MPPVRIAIVGGGLIGERHARFAAAEPGCELVAIADPAPAIEKLAAGCGARWYRDHVEMLDAERPQGVIVATPNRLHVPVGRACIERGIAALVEKPLADTLEAARELVETAERAGVALMTGHHRRFNPLVEAAHAILRSGELGDLLAVNALWSARKPDDYFETAWRREPGGGPILINLIHDIDCLRHLCGEIEEVRALTGASARDHAVEDTAAILLRFAGGALGTVTLSDAAPSPWSWEAGSGDNPGIATSGQNCYHFLGTRAALGFPVLAVWRHAGGAPGHWGLPLQCDLRPVEPREALAGQIAHFCAVIEGRAEPRVSGREGLATLAATLAVHEAARTGAAVRPPR